MKRDKQVRLTSQEKIMIEGLRDANLFPLEVVDFLKNSFENDFIRRSKIEQLAKDLAEKFDWEKFFKEDEKNGL